jgi:hypothetical protein
MNTNTQRYEVVAEYPSSTYKIGDILHSDTENMSAFFGKYPNLFRALSWWEHVLMDELPKYVKWVDGSCTEYFKVDKWVLEKPTLDDIEGILFVGDNPYSGGLVYDYIGEIYPSTYAEYNDYLTKLNSK